MKDFEVWLVPQCRDEVKFVLELGEKGVAALDFALHDGQVKVGTPRQRLFIDLCAATDEDVVREFLRIEFVERLEDEDLGFDLLAELGEVELVGTLQVLATTPFMVLAENQRVLLD